MICCAPYKHAHVTVFILPREEFITQLSMYFILPV